MIVLCVVLICHDETKVFNAKTKDEYELIFPKNTFSKAGNCLKDIPDFIIYLEPQGVDDDGNVILSIGHTAYHDRQYFAGGRFPECPTEIAPFTAENLKEAVKIACERRAEAIGAKCVDYEVVAQKDAAERESKKLSLADLKEMIAPAFKALLEAGYGESVSAVVERYLGEGAKVSEATDSQKDKLKFIYDKLCDLAEEKEVEWE